jgi:hypothetical protein
MKCITSAGVVLKILLAALIHAAVVIVEVPDDDAVPVAVADVVDGDTVKLKDGGRIRMVGYDAYELTEQLGMQAKQELRGLCPGEAYLDIDDLEPKDRYGRTLGYLWCQRTDGNATWYISVQKFFVIGDGRKYVKRLFHIPPDEHPYTLWAVRHIVKFNTATEIYVYNDSRAPYRIYGDVVVLTSGVYEVYHERRLVARLRLMSHTPNTTTVNLPIVHDADVSPPVPTATTPPVTAAQTATRTATATTAVAQAAAGTAAVTSAAAVEGPYVSIIYIAIIAAAVVVLAVYIARRNRSAA